MTLKLICCFSFHSYMYVYADNMSTPTMSIFLTLLQAMNSKYWKNLLPMMILVNFMNMLNGLGLKNFAANTKKAYYSTFIDCECCTKGFFFHWSIKQVLLIIILLSNVGNIILIRVSHFQQKILLLFFFLVLCFQHFLISLYYVTDVAHTSSRNGLSALPVNHLNAIVNFVADDVIFCLDKRGFFLVSYGYFVQRISLKSSIFSKVVEKRLQLCMTIFKSFQIV